MATIPEDVKNALDTLKNYARRVHWTFMLLIPKKIDELETLIRENEDTIEQEKKSEEVQNGSNESEKKESEG